MHDTNRRMSVLIRGLAIVGGAWLCAFCRESPGLSTVSVGIQEGYPDSVVLALSNRAAALLSAAKIREDSSILDRVQSVITLSRSWKPGEHVRVAFLGGSPAVQRQIAQAVRVWTDTANLLLDFGPVADSQHFAEWSPADSQYRAEIRIAFLGGRNGGYWSYVGTESIDPEIAKAGQPSMNLEGFDRQLPSDWKSTVLHEFGHALGFQHEHQNPNSNCEQEFRWEDDPGYVPTRDTYGQFVNDRQGHKPGIYTVLGGPPNNWQKPKVDYNLRVFANSADLRISFFDKRSIMKYYFPGWMFRNGTASSCFSLSNDMLSAQDLRAAAEQYPREAAVNDTSLVGAAQRFRGTLGDTLLSTSARARLVRAFTSYLVDLDKIRKKIH